MKHWHYYNENDPAAATWLRALMKEGLIPDGCIDDSDIRNVDPDDIRHFTGCHFFAGIGGWVEALRIAGWPTDRPVWTGSPPCQPYSSAGKQLGNADPRNLWPEFFRLIRECRPSIVFGEQVAAAIKPGWLDRICADLEGENYAVGAAVLPACSVDAPHKRDRLWFVADSNGGSRWGHRREARRRAEPADGGRMANSHGQRFTQRPERDGVTCEGIESPCGNDTRRSSFWANAGWIVGPDGKARRIKPGVRLLAHGVPGRVAKLRGLGNAIVPQVAAEVIRCFV